ncbi:MAG: diacylglycerol kinase family protein [Candidatus Hydrothermales bacterium]
MKNHKKKRKGIKVGVIFNPYSGSGRSFEVLKWLKERLRIDKLKYYVEKLEKKINIKENLLRLKEKGVHKIIVLGGDGTLFHIVNNLPFDFKIPFCLFPSGSGNDFLKTIFGKKKDLNFFYEVFKEGIVMESFTGEIITKEGKLLFTNAAGIGFDAKIAERALRIKNLRGLLRYLLSLLIELKGNISYEMEIKDDNNYLMGKYILLGLGLGKYLGGGFHLFPDASPFKEEISVCIIKNMKKTEVLKKLHHVIKGTHLSLPECLYFKTKDLKLSLKEDSLIQLDGEVSRLKRGDIEAKISQKKFSFLYKSPI